MSDEKETIKTINDIEKSLDNVSTYNGEPLSEHDREVIKQFLIDKYLK